MSSGLGGLMTEPGHYCTMHALATGDDGCCFVGPGEAKAADEAVTSWTL